MIYIFIMKNRLFILFFLFISVRLFSQTDLQYYLPPWDYDQDIPEPSRIIGHEIGEWHVTHDKLVHYMSTLAESSDRIILEEYARSFENRPLFHLIITSPENHSRLEQIRKEHLKLSDPEISASLDITEMPLVIRMGYNVHGNESSAANASLVVAYYLAASVDKKVIDYLDQMIILLDPCLNPDGFNRHACWVNSCKNIVPMTDDNSRGFREEWPGGRTNHYWFDLNRDWILVQQPETRGRVDVFQQWMPNVQTDHHEMGAGSSFYFQPGIPVRTNPMTPQRTTDLTKMISNYHRKALDSIGSLYFTEEVFDDFYYGKGSTYPDIHGSVGILFEQAGTRGFIRETENGLLTFPFAIRNQVTVSLSTLEASFKMRKELLEHQRSSYREAIELAGQNIIKGYIFTEPDDPSRLNHFIDILLKHRIRVYHLNKEYNSGTTSFNTSSSFIIPLKQPQYRLIESFFRADKNFSDSIFYDISAWTLPYAFNINYQTITSQKILDDIIGEKLSEIPEQSGILHGERSNIGYLLPWNDYYSPKALYHLQSAGLITKVASEPFTYPVEDAQIQFGYGTIFIPVYGQKPDAGEIFQLITGLTKEEGISFYSVETSYTLSGIDLGSPNFLNIEKPDVLLFTGDGVSSSEAGEIWHLLDTRFAIPVTLIEQEQIDHISLEDYNVLIMPGGSYYNIGNKGKDEIKTWLEKGGTLIAISRANNWLNDNGFTSLKFNTISKDTTITKFYKDLQLERGAMQIPGSIFKANLDFSHPVGYGTGRSTIPVFKNNTLFVEKAKNPYATPVYYTSDPLLSGYINKKNYKLIKNSAVVIVTSVRSGRIISFIEDPNFRAFWFGTNKLFMNAIFFGQTISSESGD
jgi:hypothetical protein